MWRQRGPGAARRWKTYHAECGYVWEYVFAGREGAAYVFEASAARGELTRIAIEVDAEALRSAAGREVSDVEQYAAAKMSLLRAFDRYPPRELPPVNRPTRADFREILETLDLL